MPMAPMPSLRHLAALSLLMALGAHAAPAGHHAAPGHPPAKARTSLHSPPAQRPMAPHPHGHGMPAHPMHPDTAGEVRFNMAQHHAALAYFSEPEHQGFVPPGLARKGGLPPGQARQWQRGQRLPAGVSYFALPRSLELVLGPPPAGHRYVRVATDILLLAIGTGIVVDAMEDLVR